MRVEIDVGKTTQNQTVLLKASQQGDGSWQYDLVKLPLGHRDGLVHLLGLTDAVLGAIAKAHAQVKSIGNPTS